MAEPNRLEKCVSAAVLLGGHNPKDVDPAYSDSFDHYVDSLRFRYLSVMELTRGGIPPRGFWSSLPVLGEIHDRCRELLSAPVWVKWWYRSPELNATVGGATRSDHLTASAFDMYFPSPETKDVALHRVIAPLYESELFEMSVGNGHRMLHVGVFSEGGQRRWEY